MAVDPVTQVGVAVVGGGLSGLTAAFRLKQAGIDVALLEAADQVGGRVAREWVGDETWLDLGAAWVGPTQDRIVALAAEVGVGIFPQHVAGRNAIDLDGKVHRYRGTIPKVGLITLIDVARMQLGVTRAARRVDPARPWLAPDAARLDSISVAEWLRRRRHGRRTTRLLAVAAKTVWGAELEELSMLYLLHYVASAGGLDPLLDTEGGAQESRLVGGSWEVASRVADELGDRVSTGSPVRAIGWSDEGVKLTLDSGVLSAERAIIALPPPACARIAFTPELPAGRRAVHERWRMGALTKVFALYPKPFWRDEGLSGESLSDSSPASLVFDVSPPGGECGVLLGFVGAGDARDFANRPEAARDEVLEGFSRIHGPRALAPEQVVVRDWQAQPWIGGAPVAIAPPGAISAGGEAIREPVGPIHWASSETAEAWAGYMDGAVRAGERAAAEVLAAGIRRT